MIKLERFTNKARESLEKAQHAALQLHQSQVDAEHLLFGITFVEGSLLDGVFSHAGIDAADARQRIRQLVERGQTLDDSAAGGAAQVYLTPEAHDVLKRSEDEMEQMGDRFIGTEHILLALVGSRRGRAATWQGSWPRRRHRPVSLTHRDRSG